MRNSFGLLVAPVAIVAMLAAAGCGSSNNDNSGSTSSTPTTSTTPAGGGGGGKATKLVIAADSGGALKFDTDKLSAKAGKVTITMDNPSTVPHSVAIEGNGVDKDGSGGTTGVGQGKKSTVTADLKPGTYEFYCPVDSHKQAGMEGTLTVQ